MHKAPDLRERKLSGEPVDEFFAAVKRTWDDPTTAHPGGESNAAAQRRGVAVVQRLRAQHPAAHIALATHGNLLALGVATLRSERGLRFLARPDDARHLHIGTVG